MKIKTSNCPCRSLGVAALAGLGLALLIHQTPAQGASNPMPQVVTENGRHAFMVDGAPFLMLGAQCHNSSGWPDILPKVFGAIDDLHANTLPPVKIEPHPWGDPAKSPCALWRLLPACLEAVNVDPGKAPA